MLRPVQDSSMVIFGGCTHIEAFGDVWQLRIADGTARWEELPTSGMSTSSALHLVYPPPGFFLSSMPW